MGCLSPSRVRGFQSFGSPVQTWRAVVLKGYVSDPPAESLYLTELVARVYVAFKSNILISALAEARHLSLHPEFGFRLKELNVFGLSSVSFRSI